MEVIQSFTIDHTKLNPGIYISREDGNFTTFDLRITKPNREPAMSPAAIHTLEHLMATWFRNNVDIKGDVVYVGPMGCHGKGTKILMYDGSVKNVEDIVIGDLLIGEHSEPVKVLNLIQGYDTLYEISQNHGDTFTATGKHLLHLTYSKSEKCFGATKGDTIDITVEDFIKTSNKFKRLFKGYKRGFKEGKQEALVELQKNNPNKDLPSNEVLFRIFELLHECKENDSKTCSCYMNQYEHYANYITKHWNKE